MKKHEQGSFHKRITTLSGTTLEKDIGYISLEGFGSGDSVAMVEYANELQKLIR